MQNVTLPISIQNGSSKDIHPLYNLNLSVLHFNEKADSNNHARFTVPCKSGSPAPAAALQYQPKLPALTGVVPNSFSPNPVSHPWF